MTNIKIKTKGMHCSSCEKIIEKAIRKIDGLGTQNKGMGCWPSYLPHEVNGDQINIKISDIVGGKHRFN